MSQPLPQFLHGQDGLQALKNAWQFSEQLAQSLRSEFQNLPDSVASIAVCGSVKRMEAHSGSDLDLIVILDDRTIHVTESERRNIQQNVRDAVRQNAELNQFQAPKPGGLFSICASWRQLIDPDQRGVVDEDMATFGHRMHILVDAVAVAGEASFAELQKDILNWYSEELITKQFGGCPPFDWLKQDVLRYWHSIHARAYWLFRDQPAKSAMVNLKLRSSRLLQVTAFLLRLQEAGQLDEDDRLEAVFHSGTRSPLETIVPLLPAQQATQLLTAWQSIWVTLSAGVTGTHQAEDRISDLRAIQKQIESLGLKLL